MSAHFMVVDVDLFCTIWDIVEMKIPRATTLCSCWNSLRPTDLNFCLGTYFLTGDFIFFY